jgi:hypothetical protein
MAGDDPLGDHPNIPWHGAHSRNKNPKLVIKIGESTTKFILQALLLLGVVIIAASGHDGWGWLVFILILSML